MKSIIEEASSVAKAVEKGWIQAGKPTEFSVKVFEVEQKNFLGMTTKSAKIGIFYGSKVGHAGTLFAECHDKKNEAPPRSNPSNHQQSRRNQELPAPEKQGNKGQRPLKNTPQDLVKNEQKKDLNKRPRDLSAPKENATQKDREIWSPEMIEAASQWLNGAIRMAELPEVSFTTEAKNYYLKFNFTGSLFALTDNERLFFRSTAHLLMQALRNKFKRSLRGFKVILNSPQSNSN